MLAAALDHILNFEKALTDVNTFIDTTEKQLEDFDTVPLSNVDVVDALIDKHKVIFLKYQLYSR